jgi:hypothetical protein
MAGQGEVIRPRYSQQGGLGRRKDFALGGRVRGRQRGKTWAGPPEKLKPRGGLVQIIP